MRKMVSTSGARRRFINAIWNSNSKSDTARNPRTMTWAFSAVTKSTSKPSSFFTFKRDSPGSDARINSNRSSMGKSGLLPSLGAAATTTSSKSRKARSITST